MNINHISPGIYFSELGSRKRKETGVNNGHNKSGLLPKDNKLHIEFTYKESDSDCIDFEDKEVERICIENFSINGECITYKDAKNILDIGWIFRGNTNIQTLTDLKYFENLKVITSSAFEGCTNAKEIVLPKSIVALGGGCFNSMSNLKRVIFLSTTPPRLGNESVNNGGLVMDVYYPLDKRRIKSKYILHFFVPKGYGEVYRKKIYEETFTYGRLNLSFVEMGDEIIKRYT